MEPLARWVSNRNVAWGIVIAVALLSAVSLVQVRKLQNEDDVLAFLPQDNPDVKLFHDINKRFGGLDLALVGIEVDDPFEPDFLRKLQRVTADLADDPGLDHVLSLANVVDFTPDPERGGVITAPLVRHIPATDEEKAALREKVMSRDHVVGSLISADGRAVLIYSFLTHGVDHKTMAARIQTLVRDALPDAEHYWGGGPFVATYIYNTTQNDLRRLTPWAVLAIVVIILLAFKDWIGALLALVTTGIGISFTLGLMALFEVPFNIVLGAMPIILFAIGSAYGIHLLSRYYFLAEKHDTGTALIRTLVGLGPVVLAAGLTTVASLLSFVLMDIRPIRTFGFFTAFGILATLVLSLTFIPAVVRLTNLKRKQGESLLMRKAMVRLTVFAQTHRLAVGGALGAIAVFCAFWVSRVDTSVDQTTFFSEGSPPDRAEKFLAEHFGGGQFVQLFVEGDMNDPHTLREIRRVADRIARHPNVSHVRHIGQALALSNNAMVGQQRIPDTSAQVRMLYSLMLGDPALAQLLSPDHDQGLVHIQVNSNRAADLDSVLQLTERTLAEELITSFETARPGHPRWAEAASRKRDMLTWRLIALARFYEVELPDKVEKLVGSFLQRPVPAAERSRIRAGMLRFLGSEECAVELAQEPRERVVAALTGLTEPPSEKRLLTILAGVLAKPEDDELVEDLAWSVATPLEESRRGARADQQATALIAELGLAVPPGGKGERFAASLGAAFWDQDNASALVPLAGGAAERPAAASLKMQANGLPVMHRGLSRSIESNQIKSLIFAVLLIIVILSVLFRSVISGLLAATPTLLTLIVIYGGMGILQVHLDIGTSMLASIILGVGVDYAVHLVSAWHSTDGGTLISSAANAADRTGPAIWTNAIMIFCGFFVLTMGEARPLQNVGGLTAAAMLVAALATFLAIPVLARKLRYRRSQALPEEDLECSEAVDAVLSKALPIKS